jgi:phosphoglycolate phosphatase
MMVGDSGTDAATARAAGVPFLLHAGGYCNAPRETLGAWAAFDDFDALPGLVAAIVAGPAGA